jgi:hypothetical protein
MRNIFAIILYNGLLLLFSCDKGDVKKDCGCNGEITFTIQEPDELVGSLYKNTSMPSDNIPDYNYGIWFDEVTCGNCKHYFFICNDSFLTDLGEIPTYPGIEVRFSGDAKGLCKTPISPADYTYNYLLLKKIEVQ